ncbi:SubName: Full=Uncharacterized protein {ECO:0000313/EMBL:CCA68983.1} [Serendipita indica DSM 11827]|uniref:Tubulin-specific chaperone A n=1 Tax=Serendipita indica (strain DSM 11827) TaxID=1109443 RepID=G4TCF9_SERID|nr:SubName: Full=Uncharacterized protein {ECO:0000313/EMBL:CCA68983.1} [Serendipita indica DSM 11827]CCA68983.1 hypothetical protein PIIN_11681 [Serendipita indica DSM 11827]
MSDATKEKRQLKIKTGAVTRLWKEHTLYRNEQNENQAKLDKMRADGEADEWKLKNQVSLPIMSRVQECGRLIALGIRRI